MVWPLSVTTYIFSLSNQTLMIFISELVMLKAVLLTMKLPPFFGNQITVLFNQSFCQNQVLWLHSVTFNQPDWVYFKFSSSIRVSYMNMNRQMFEAIKEKLHSKHSEDFWHVCEVIVRDW